MTHANCNANLADPLRFAFILRFGFSLPRSFPTYAAAAVQATASAVQPVLNWTENPSSVACCRCDGRSSQLYHPCLPGPDAALRSGIAVHHIQVSTMGCLGGPGKRLLGSPRLHLDHHGGKVQKSGKRSGIKINGWLPGHSLIAAPSDLVAFSESNPSQTQNARALSTGKTGHHIQPRRAWRTHGRGACPDALSLSSNQTQRRRDAKTQRKTTLKKYGSSIRVNFQRFGPSSSRLGVSVPLR